MPWRWAATRAPAKVPRELELASLAAMAFGGAASAGMAAIAIALVILCSLGKARWPITSRSPLLLGGGRRISSLIFATARELALEVPALLRQRLGLLALLA